MAARLRAISTLTAITLLMGTATGCEGSYKPPFVPIAFFINERGERSVSFDASIVTPIGTFSLNVPLPEMARKDDGLIEVQHVRDGEPVRSLFLVRDFAKGSSDIAVDGGSGIRKSGDRKKRRSRFHPVPSNSPSTRTTATR